MALTSFIILSVIVILANAEYFNYHDTVGIPAATRIRELETRALLGEPIFGINIRIVHGTEASIGTYSYPWLAGLVINLAGRNDIISVCGASLVSRNRLTTAGHCWYEINEKGEPQQATLFEVVLASRYLFYGGVRIKTKHVVTHPKWGEGNIFNTFDIAMIHLPTDVTFNENISPINLPLNYTEESFVGYITIGAGYGSLNDGQRKTGILPNATIHQVGLTVITNDECGRYIIGIEPCCICTSGLNGVGICQGDSGGPLVTYIDDVPILIGISSKTARDGCEIGLPSIFTRVTEVLDFINLHLEEQATNTVVKSVEEI